MIFSVPLAPKSIFEFIELIAAIPLWLPDSAYAGTILAIALVKTITAANDIAISFLNLMLLSPIYLNSPPNVNYIDKS